MNPPNPAATDVKVSVVMITYNHERFISQAIESVLMQQADFGVELVIGEDCSTDGTRAIARNYGERYPGRIRLLLPEHNLGMMPNFIATLRACNGQYIALCEGDDYWIDPLKLQKQVDFLEAHPECVLCVHDVLIVYEDGSLPSYRQRAPGHKRIYGLEDVLTSGLTHTGSLLFRSAVSSGFPDWFCCAPIGDWALNVLLAEHGQIGYLDDMMSAWRRHAGGAWFGRREHDQLTQTLQMYDLLQAHFGDRYTSVFEPERAVCHYGLALNCWLDGLPEEQARWMKLVAEEFPGATEPLLRKALDATQDVEASHGQQAAEEAVDWTCDALRTRPGGQVWAKKLRSEWYAGYACKAYQRNDDAAVRRASRHAVRHGWRILKNRGFVSRWLQAMIGRRTWIALRRVASVASVQSGEKPSHD